MSGPSIANPAHPKQVLWKSPHFTLSEWGVILLAMPSGVCPKEVGKRVLAKLEQLVQPRHRKPSKRVRYPIFDGRSQPYLTQAEMRALCGAMQGLSNQAIAANLKVSLRSVEYRFQNIYRKIQVKGRADLLHFLSQPGHLISAIMVENEI